MTTNLRAYFTPHVFINSDGGIEVDWQDSLQNVLDLRTQKLHDDPGNLPPDARHLVAQVDGLLTGRGVAGFLRLLADQLDTQDLHR